MRSLVWLLAVFAAAVALALHGRIDQGYAMFVYPPWRVETSMVFFAALALVLFVALYLLVRAVHHAVSLPDYVRAFRARRRRERAQAALVAALQAYYEGRYLRAEREAGVAWEAGVTPGLAALLAARAAHAMRDFAGRERWLERAGSLGEAMQTAQTVTRAEMALEERDFLAARDALKSGAGPRQIATQRMLLRAERGAANWHEVLRIASQLSKRDAISPALAEEYQVQAHIELLAAEGVTRQAFEERWRRVPGRYQSLPRVALAAARQAAGFAAARLCREIIEGALAEEWNAQLVRLYGELPGLPAEERTAEARARIERAERWLLEHQSDAQLLATLGRLCAHAELWGKAQSCLEASLSFEESRAARLELARLAERLGREPEAQRHYRKAAELP